ncbi:Rrf2 family transcriptional regulator [Dichotomicrobium thermohalophilum]|uniref:BadM/Rrf2 family transcriptional regulator n=1 Tax=Dichotomicrobium thermohalophilum TaxID=933063 RepID=A0A397QEJ4_9HYPH|nr:Rrf2 family transcriptional regulator [Dichotomicrobium thermohalophilum]RIA56691.1 BadM/Rrf2 family transcriptional regulator [Dichotomicrobium thermohalophilum]
MQLSTKGRYAVMAMVDLASRSSDSPIRLASIAEKQQISLAYLEQLFTKLRRAGLVTSARGPGGGYRLSRRPEEIFVSEIMNAVDEPIKMTRCISGSEIACIGNKGRCLTHDLWRALGDHILLFLQTVTLRDVLDGDLVLKDSVFSPSVDACAKLEGVTAE